jgi:hypothetical protein
MAKLIFENGYPIVRIDWNLEDFEERAADLELDLNREQLINAMKEVAHCHDCNYGINWETIDLSLENQLEVTK